MSFITVLTGVDMKPWKIPQRVQQVLMNQYLSDKNIFPDIIYSAGIFTEHFSRLFMILDERPDVKNIVFTSIFQISKSESGIKIFKKLVSIYQLHFALENLIVTNLDELNVVIKELLISRKLPAIEDYNIESLHNLTKFR